MADLPMFDRPAADPVRDLSYQMERASFLTQASLRNSFARMHNAEAVLNELLEALAANGLIRPEQVPLAIEVFGQETDQDGAAVNPADPSAGEPMVPDVTSPLDTKWPGVILRNDPQSSVPDRPVDCEARLPICHAVCCTLKFPLTASEVDAGKVKWDLGHPYMIRGDERGWCSHNDPDSGGCTVYDDRPGVCRTYSCANDGRIWKDFDAMILNVEWLTEHFVDPGKVRVSIRAAAGGST